MEFAYIVIYDYSGYSFGFFPIENSVITFSSPEKAFYYFQSAEIKLVVSGNETDFVSVSNHNSNSFLILPKTEKVWKISTGNDLKIVCKKTH